MGKLAEKIQRVLDRLNDLLGLSERTPEPVRVPVRVRDRR